MDEYYKNIENKQIAIEDIDNKNYNILFFKSF